MVPNTGSVNLKNQCIAVALLHEEKDGYTYVDEESNKVQRADTLWNLKSTGEFVVVAKFVTMCCIV